MIFFRNISKLMDGAGSVLFGEKERWASGRKATMSKKVKKKRQKPITILTKYEMTSASPRGPIQTDIGDVLGIYPNGRVGF